MNPSLRRLSPRRHLLRVDSTCGIVSTPSRPQLVRDERLGVTLTPSLLSSRDERERETGERDAGGALGRHSRMFVRTIATQPHAAVDMQRSTHRKPAPPAAEPQVSGFGRCSPRHGAATQPGQTDSSPAPAPSDPSTPPACGEPPRGLSRAPQHDSSRSRSAAMRA
jgi:hypothetical protein